MMLFLGEVEADGGSSGGKRAPSLEKVDEEGERAPFWPVDVDVVTVAFEVAVVVPSV